MTAVLLLFLIGIVTWLGWWSLLFWMPVTTAIAIVLSGFALVMCVVWIARRTM